LSFLTLFNQKSSGKSRIDFPKFFSQIIGLALVFVDRFSQARWSIMLFVAIDNCDRFVRLSKQELRELIILPCCQAAFIFWGSYYRQPLPELPPLWIPRVRCKNCGVTHAVLPAFLFAYMRYTTATLTVYVEQAATNSLPPIETWNQGLADGPQNSETLYRWLRRLRPRLAVLLPLLKSQLLTLNPAVDFSPLERFVLKFKKNSPQHVELKPSPQSPIATPCSPPATLSMVALCAISYWLSEHVLQLAGELLQAPSPLLPVAFLNYFAWQKIGVTLISPPPKSRPP
jgi:hypothetical protein